MQCQAQQTTGCWRLAEALTPSLKHTATYLQLGEAETHACACRRALEQDAVSGAAEDWVLARYQDPSTRPWFRRNEVLLQLSEFDLWAAGCYQL